MRNFLVYAEKGKRKVPRGYALTAPECQALYEMAKRDRGRGLFDALATSFYGGFEAGYRAGRRGGEGNE